MVFKFFKIFFCITFLFVISCANSIDSQSFSHNPGQPTKINPSSLIDNIKKKWLSVLNEDAPAIIDRVISFYTPGCEYFFLNEELTHYLNGLRDFIIESADIDTEIYPISTEKQRTLYSDLYKIEVISLEIFHGYFLPINVYIPTFPMEGKLPLIINPVGCGSSVWSEDSQYLAGNLAGLGMIVIVTEGFCYNGSRADFPDSISNIGYSRKLLGLRGDTSFYLHELIGTLNWAFNYIDFIDPNKIAITGYSYGGMMSMLLSNIDSRIKAISVPATGNIGNPTTSYYGNLCSNFALPSDKIYFENNYLDHYAYRPPLKVPILPLNSGVLLSYPRPILLTSSPNDKNNLPLFMDEVFTYGLEVYSLGSVKSNITYIVDEESHNYGKKRRQYTYDWLIEIFSNEESIPYEEKNIFLFSPIDLKVDISGTKTLYEGLTEEVDFNINRRFKKFPPSESNYFYFFQKINKIFDGIMTLPLEVEDIWFNQFDNIYINAQKFKSSHYSFPVFIFENTKSKNEKTLLYLPQNGTLSELDNFVIFLHEYKYVISIDYLGIGELESTRLTSETFGSYFMNNFPNLPQININLIRSFLKLRNEKPLDIYTEGWVSGIYGLFLKNLETSIINKVFIKNVPDNELEYLKLGKKVPELLLWTGFFSSFTVEELAAGLGQDAFILK